MLRVIICHAGADYAALHSAVRAYHLEDMREASARRVYLVLHAQLDCTQISTVGNAEADCLFELTVIDKKIHAPRENLHPHGVKREAWFSSFLPEVGQL